MKLSVREQWMLAALPAFLTGVMYFGLSAHPASTELEKLRKQIAKQGPLTTRMAQVRHAQEERADLHRSIADEASSGTTAGTTFDRNRSLQFISQLCQSHGLALVSSAPDSAAKVPPSLQEAASVVAPASAGSAKIWRIQLRGSYGAMLAMLEALRASESFIVPLSVGMQLTGGDERKPLSWELSLWL